MACSSLTLEQCTAHGLANCLDGLAQACRGGCKTAKLIIVTPAIACRRAKVGWLRNAASRRARVVCSQRREPTTKSCRRDSVALLQKNSRGLSNIARHRYSLVPSQSCQALPAIRRSCRPSLATSRSSVPSLKLIITARMLFWISAVSSRASCANWRAILFRGLWRARRHGSGGRDFLGMGRPTPSPASHRGRDGCCHPFSITPNSMFRTVARLANVMVPPFGFAPHEQPKPSSVRAHRSRNTSAAATLQLRAYLADFADPASGANARRSAFRHRTPSGWP